MEDLTKLIDKDQLMENLEDMKEMSEEQKELDQMMEEMGVGQEDPDVLAMYEEFEAEIVEEDFENIPETKEFAHKKQKNVQK